MKVHKAWFRRRNVKREVRKRHFQRGFGLALGVVLLLGLAWGGREAVRRLDFFALKKIEVQGKLRTLTQAELFKKAGVPMGTNMFRIDLDLLRSRLLSHGYFREVVVHRNFPHTLVFEIQEYVPEFLLNTGRFYYVDPGGDIFKDITETNEPRDMPIVSGISEEDLITQPEETKKLIRSAVELKSIYRESEFYRRFGLSEIHYEKNNGFTLYPEKEKYSIKFGNADFSEKIKKLSQVLEQLEKNSIRFSSIDLNYPGKVLMTL